jgi:DICT domain-containing protein
MMIDLSGRPAQERADRYRELAREARVQATMSRPATQFALEKLAGHWEDLASCADVEDSSQ